MAKKQEVEARHYDVVLAPHITEKATLASENNAVVFKVANDATKPQIKEAVERAFEVTVTAVNTSNERGRRPRLRTGRRSGTPSTYKKAIVTVAEGDEIEFFEGV